MATQFNFNGKTKIIPGVYSTIKSGIDNPSIELDFGTTLIIDTGSGAGYGGGAGIAGESANGEDAIYRANSIAEMQSLTKGGLWYLLARPLFRPSGAANGVSQVLFARAAETTGAVFKFEFTGGGTDGGDIEFKCKDEGEVGNGVEDVDNVLRKGYAIRMVSEGDGFALEFYRGTFAGSDSGGQGYGEIKEENAQPQLLFSSDEFSTISELKEWADNSFEFNQLFSVSDYVETGSGTVDSADLSNYTGNNLLSGGTETYSSDHLNTVLDKVSKLNVSFILADEFGDDAAQSANNVRLQDHIMDESRYKPELYIGAGNDNNEFVFSQETANFFNSDFVTVVHGDSKRPSRNVTSGFKTWPSIYTAAAYLGREAGLEPQVPTTFKSVSTVSGTTDPLDDKQVVTALKAGLMVGTEENNSFDIVKGVNSLQNNRFLVNEDGTTHSKQIKRIARQLNKEIIVNARRELLKNPDGVNRNTLSPEGLRTWTENFLKARIANPTDDNLILGFDNVTVEREQDAYRVNYGFVPNSEISFLFFTGFMLDV